jgi:hypothetical protein
MVSKQSFYNETAKELIEEWISNKRFEEELDERSTIDRTTICTDTSTVRSQSYEPPSIGEDMLATA